MDVDAPSTTQEEKKRVFRELEQLEKALDYFSQELQDELEELFLAEHQPTLDELVNLKEKLHKDALTVEPPPPRNVRIEKKDGVLLARWDAPTWPLPVRYSGKYYISTRQNISYTPMPNAGESLSDHAERNFEEIDDNCFELQNISPLHRYEVEVRCVCDNGMQSIAERTKDPVMLCKSLDGHVFVDESKILRHGHHVYRGYLKHALDIKEAVAVKVLTSKNHREVKHMLKLSSNPCIVSYRTSGVVEGSVGQWFIAMELCDTKNLDELISRKELVGSELKCALSQIAHGLATLHAECIVHRDLKPQNILLSLDKSHVKITDFGTSMEVKSNESLKADTQSCTGMGTERWRAPETYAVENVAVSTKSDIFSAGLIYAFALSGGKHPYGQDSEADYITKNLLPDLTGLTCEDSKIAEDLIRKMLDRDPRKRPNIEEVLKHPFFWNSRKKLEYFCWVSDFFRQFQQSSGGGREAYKEIYERIRQMEKGENWIEKIEKKKDVGLFLSLDKLKRYDSTSIFGLLRFIRNAHKHRWEHGKEEESLWTFVSECFPDLLCTIWNTISKRMPESDSMDPFLGSIAPCQPLRGGKEKGIDL